MIFLSIRNRIALRGDMRCLAINEKYTVLAFSCQFGLKMKVFLELYKANISIGPIVITNDEFTFL